MVNGSPGKNASVGAAGRSGSGHATRSVLAVNSGSSSIKFALFGVAAEPALLDRGSLDAPDRATAIDQVLERLADHLSTSPLAAVGHRIVHGGPDFRDPQVVTDAIIDALNAIVRFAPNHLPDEIALIEAVRRRLPDLPQVVCFDTAFHASLPDVARTLAIPSQYAAHGVRRYGFHGLSYTYLIDELRRRTANTGGPDPNGRVILAHLGNGSSLAAVQNGRSIDTSMGFTPIGGIVMGTRSGDLDPGVVTFIARVSALNPDQVEREMSHRSGLLGISGKTADMRELIAHEADDQSCRLAVSIYCYEIKKRIGAYAAALGGLDHLVFSGGIGEHAALVRARICAGLEFLGIEIDPRHNAANAALISTAAAQVGVHVIPSDEEVVIARAVCHLLD
jgi:acetate kinase